MLEPGDRVRVVAPPDKMALIALELGDNERRVSEFQPLGFSIGLLLGLLVGLVPIPMPGVGTIELGSAGGPLLVGLVLGSRERSGPFVWQAPARRELHAPSARIAVVPRHGRHVGRCRPAVGARQR